MAEDSPEELPPSYRFGDHLIRACIGRGAMARVYSARSSVSGETVALKVLDRWVHEHPAGKERFLREAQVAAAVKHENVVNILDVGVWKKRRYIVMELLTGHDLDEHLERHQVLPVEEVIAIALPVISGMIAVHEAGVVHRDLKPSNIFLCQERGGETVPKVLDFGISKFSDVLDESVKSPTRTRDIIGTPTYMAPEALNGVRQLGPLADQYSLGAVLYECVVGRPPFEGETLLQLLKEISLGKISLPRSVRPEVPVPLESAVLRAMHTTPAARFPTLRELGQALWPMADEETREKWSGQFGTDSEPVTLVTIPKAGLPVTLPPDPNVDFPRLRPTVRWRRVFATFAMVGGLAFLCVRALSENAGSLRAPRVTLQPRALHPSDRAAPAPTALEQPAEESSPPESLPATPRRGRAEPSRASSKAPLRRSLRAILSERHRKSPPSAARPGAGSPATNDQRASRQEVATEMLDPDLAAFFDLPRSTGGAAEARAAGKSEVSNLFPRDDPPRAVGANGAPLLD